MNCRDLMKTDAHCVSPADTVEQAAVRMREQNVGFLPVCDQSRKVLGTVTDRDIAVRVVAAGRSSDTPVEDAMTRELVACSPEDDVQRALQLMAENQKSRIVCVDEQGCLEGVISLSDIAQSAEVGGRGAETLRRITEREARPH